MLEKWHIFRRKSRNLCVVCVFLCDKFSLVSQNVILLQKIIGMEFSAQQLAGLLNGQVVGDPNVMVSDFSKIEEGRPGTLTFLANPKYTEYIYTTKASLVLVNADFVPEKNIDATLIKVENSYSALATLMSMVENMNARKSGVHETAVISEKAELGGEAYVGAYTVIEDGVKIGANPQIYPHVYIGDGVQIGDNVTLYPGVKIYKGCVLGNNVVIHAGAIVGSDGFGFAPDSDGRYNKIPQVGNVVIEDDVEIGANTTVDRSTMGSTIIRRGVKLDNLIQIAHNVEVGEDTVMAAMSAVAGSTKIGKHCMFGGQTGCVGHLSIADGSVFAARTGVSNTIKEEGQMYQGYPHMDAKLFRRAHVCFKNLPDMRNTLIQLQKQVEELQKLINK